MEQVEALVHASSFLGNPYPVENRAYVYVDTRDMREWFLSMRSALIDVLHLRGGGAVPQDVISEEDWVTVCRFLVKARVDHVYEAVVGRARYPPGRCFIPRPFKLPKLMADIVNRIGSVYIERRIMCPCPEEDPADPAHRLNTLASQPKMAAFSRLVALAEQKRFIRTGQLVLGQAGTAWWLLAACHPTEGYVEGGRADSVRVYADFRKWTPSDALIAAIVQRNYGHHLDFDESLLWTTEVVTDIPARRYALTLQA